MTHRNPTRWHGCRVSSVTWNGHETLFLENETLKVGINLTKGAEIFEFRHKASDLDAMCHRNCADLRAPGFDLAANSIDAFFDQYSGGWQESFPVGNSAGGFGRAQMYLHGEVCLLPWRWQVIQDSPKHLEIELEVECVRTPFQLKRRMSLEGGVAALQLNESITNLSGQALPFAWGHHIAFGPPLLDAAGHLDLPAGSVRTPPGDDKPHRRFEGGQRSDTASLRDRKGVLVDLTVVAPPESGTIDNFEIELRDAAYAAIRNPSLNLGVGLVWDRDVMPFLWGWELCRAQTGYPFWGRDYLLAFEPFNCPIGGLTDPQIRDRLPLLESGESRSLKLAIGWCSGQEPFRGIVKWLRHPA